MLPYHLLPEPQQNLANGATTKYAVFRSKFSISPKKVSATFNAIISCIEGEGTITLILCVIVGLLLSSKKIFLAKYSNINHLIGEYKMTHDHFEERKEWSKRKHDLVIRYLKGFVKILGGATKDKVYYVDGFSGPGIYEDGAKGSPVLAAEYAQSLLENYYHLHCINVEIDPECFGNLVRNPIMCQDFTTNYCGGFGDYLNLIMALINEYPTIFFLDPFGVKGMEWHYVSPILKREPITEILMRINPIDISRLAGFSDSDKPGAAQKRQLLTELYGFDNSEQWENVWNAEGTDGLVRLYKQRLLETMSEATGRAYVATYPIRTIDGIVKYRHGLS